MRWITFAEAVNEALRQSMEYDKNVIAYGLGIDDPKRVFGTTRNLKELFGGGRVFDMPTSENAMTGMAIGAALNGLRPIMTHQRLDFFLLAMDQLVNNAAKWHYMFGGEAAVPITIRLIIGRGWGQGPTHSQNLQAWFAHVPGLKVVMPSTAYDAKGLLLASIFDDNPVLFLEHRWLHELKGEVPEEIYRVPIGKAQRLKEGKNITIVSFSYMTIEALHAVEVLNRQGVSVDLIDLRSIKPIDWEMIFDSVRKTGRLLAVDTGPIRCCVAGDIVAHVAAKCFGSLKEAPQVLACPDCPTPTSLALTWAFYRRAEDIVASVGKILKKPLSTEELRKERHHSHDVPGEWFKGPF